MGGDGSLAIDPKQILAGLVVSIVGGLIVRWLTSSDILLGVTIAAVALAFFPAYRLVLLVAGYVRALSLSRLRTVLSSQDVTWLRHFDASDSHPPTIRMMMTTGVRILDNESSLVYQKVLGLPMGWKGKIRILLLHPDSKFVALRAKSRNVDEKMVKNQIRATTTSIQNVKRLRNLDIEVRYYHSLPVWRFTLFDTIGYFSYMYQGEFLRSYFEVSKGKSGLFETFSNMFDREWDAGVETIIDNDSK